MDSLLELALKAHGGLDTWNKYRALHVDISIGGALWDVKGLPGLFDDTHFELDLKRERVVASLIDLGERIIFTPDEMSLESAEGKTVEVRSNPRDSFAGQTGDSKWDMLHAGYFCSYALWGYLTTPFLYTYPGFEAHEVEPWHENGEHWRVLQVTFPEHYAAHTRTQFVCFGEDGLVGRHLYTVDVLGGARGANYAYDYKLVNGVMIATRRRVFAYNDAKEKIAEPVLVSIDIKEAQFK